MSGARFELDAAVRCRDRGRLLIGGTPPRLVRLSEAGAAALDALLGDGSPDAGPGGRPLVRRTDQGTTADGGPDRRTTADAGQVTTLARRLERGGLIHPLPEDGVGDAPVTAVVPVLDGGEGLAALVRTLAAEGPVIVVDDGSRDGSGERAAAAGARVIPNAGRPGPAGARNTGLRAAETELVAFIDADCVLAPGWRRGLAALLADDPELAMVAPRVRSRPAAPARGGAVESILARYEEGNSPLDLGAAPSLVGPGRRVAYLPAAALVARRDALLELGGFDESMRFGEDVDLVWRLLAAGGQARYVPSREVLHRPRSTLRALIAQRAGYGSSAPHLRRRHGAAVAPLHLNRHSVAIWTVAALRPRIAPAALAASVAIVAARGSDTQARLGLAEVALRGQTDAARHLTRALAREWLPLSLAAGVVSRRARRPLAAALLLGTLSGSIESTALCAVDQSAYAAGLWREMVAQREFGAVLPAWGPAIC